MSVTKLRNIIIILKRIANALPDRELREGPGSQARRDVTQHNELFCQVEGMPDLLNQLDELHVDQMEKGVHLLQGHIETFQNEARIARAETATYIDEARIARAETAKYIDGARIAHKNADQYFNEAKIARDNMTNANIRTSAAEAVARRGRQVSFMSTLWGIVSGTLWSIYFSVYGFPQTQNHEIFWIAMGVPHFIFVCFLVYYHFLA